MSRPEVEVEREEEKDGERLLRDGAKLLLTPFGFHASQKAEVFAAFRENPDGVERCALRAKAVGQREGQTGAGLLLSMIRSGEHLLEAVPDTPMPTGWRWVRSEHSGTYVEDPEGVDRLPPGYDFSTHNPVVNQPPLEEIEVAPLTGDVRSQLDRLAGRRRESEAVEGYERVGETK